MLLIQNSGELPEVAFHGALHFLTDACDGPRLRLQEGEIATLAIAVAEQYRHIILRDLNPALRDHSRYRGIARARVNWHRLVGFAKKYPVDITQILKDINRAAEDFLEVEVSDVRSFLRATCLNLSLEELLDFLQKLGLDKNYWIHPLQEVYLHK